MKNAYLECGKVINTHGFRGDVKLESWCDSPEILEGLPTVFLKEGDHYRALRVLHASVFRQFVIAGLEGIGDENAANALRNQVLYAARNDLPLPEGGYFLADLIGLPVRNVDTGELIGTLRDVDQRGYADLYVIETATGEVLVPCVPQFVIRVDPESGIDIRPIPGLLSGGENV